MGNPRAIGEAFNITGDEAMSWNQIHKTIADALGVELHTCHVSSEFLAAAGERYGYGFEGSLLGDKTDCAVFDNTKLKRVVPNMQTNIGIHQGIRLALDYAFSHPEECQTEDPEFDAWCDRVIEVLDKAKSNV